MKLFLTTLNNGFWLMELSLFSLEVGAGVKGFDNLEK